MTHSPEPWRTYSYEKDAKRKEIHYGPVIPHPDWDDDSACVLALKVLPTKEDADRIVACVNALRGVKDPESFVSCVANAIRWLGRVEAGTLSPVSQVLEPLRLAATAAGCFEEFC